MSLHQYCEPGCNRTHPGDPAYAMLIDPNIYSTPVIFRSGCYICEDPEFAQLGMPLCQPCCNCKDGHVPADQGECDDCEHECWPGCPNEHNWDHPNGKNPEKAKS
jgi:hypothetical protein